MKISLLGVNGPYPSAGGGACSCYLVECGNTRILLDMGSGGLSKAMGKECFDKIDNIFLSHFHYDHTSDMLPLKYYVESHGNRYKIFCPAPENPYAETILKCSYFTPTFIEDGMELQVGDIKLTFFKVEHTVTTYGVKISNGQSVLVYSGDTKLTDALLKICENADLLLLDASRPIGFRGPHMTIEDAKKIKELYNNAKIVVTHLLPEYDPSADLFDSGIIVGYPDLTIEIPETIENGD